MQPFKLNRLKHSYIFLYPIIYLTSFFLLEAYVEPRHLIEVPIDHLIPFCEFFIIPYYLWFLYVAITVAFFFLFLDLGDFYRMTLHLFSGMTVFILVSAIYPNGLDLRPEVFPRDNLFTDMVKGLYATDTSTNVLPSIHVYNTICIHIGIIKNKFLNSHKWITYSSGILMILIILSTAFLKQHSVIDIITGILLVFILYPLFYKKNFIPYRSQFPIESNR